MPKKILDGFTNMDVSPQRRRQLRLIAKGLCRICSAKCEPGSLECEECKGKAKARRECRKIETRKTG
jgi:hypothetical protein